MKGKTAAVTMKNITKKFGPVVASDKVNLEIYKGEIDLTDFQAFVLAEGHVFSVGGGRRAASEKECCGTGNSEGI